MNKTLYVTIRNVYGQDMLYPACDASRMVCELAGTKTITVDALRVLRKNGFMVKQDPAQIAKLLAA